MKKPTETKKIRVDPIVHRRIKIKAAEEGMTMGDIVKELLKQEGEQ